MVSIRERARSLNHVQRFMAVMAVPITATFAAQVVFDFPSPDLATVGRAMTVVGWPLLVWGILPLFSKAFIPMGQSRWGRLPKQEQQRRRSLIERRGPRRWCSHIGFTLMLLGMALYWPDNTVGPQWLNRPFQLLCIVMVVVYWVGMALSRHQQQRQGPTSGAFSAR